MHAFFESLYECWSLTKFGSIVGWHIIVAAYSLNRQKLTGLLINALHKMVAAWRYCDGLARLKNENSVGIPDLDRHRTLHADQRVGDFIVIMPGDKLAGGECQLTYAQTRYIFPVYRQT